MRGTATPPSPRRRWLGHLLNLSAYLCGLMVIGLVVNVLAQRRGMRLKIDATKTRAYSLSESTRDLLASLEDEWSIALVLVRDNVDRSVGKQVDEVLGRFDRATDALSVSRIDPTDPASLDEYEALLSRLRLIHADLLEQYETSLDAAERELDDLIIFCQQQASTLTALAKTIQLDGADDMASRAQLMTLFVDQASALVEEVEAARRVSDVQPIADYETARSILAAALSRWARDLHDISKILDDWMGDPSIGANVRQAMLEAGPQYQRRAQRLANAADPLLHLPPLDLVEIGRQLQTGEAAIVLSPTRAAVIPSGQLFPRTNVQSAAGGGISFDQRFRGEQLVASTIRSLRSDRMPRVVFVHAEPHSLLQNQPNDADLVGATTSLLGSRIAVSEWIVTDTDKPEIDDDQAVVWVVLPPLSRRGLETSPGEQRLLDTARSLIGAGESVLLNVYPSFLPKLRRTDPWAELSRPFGLTADTQYVVHERIRVAEDDVRIERGQQLRSFSDEHPIAAAVQGLPMFLTVPVPLKTFLEPADAVRHHPLAWIEPTGERWLESQWNAPIEQLQPPPAEGRMQERAVVMTAADRPSPLGAGRQRFMLVGGGGWMMSFVADVAASVGGDRFALVHPGNYEMLLASVYWLSGEDELIAASATSREVARLANLPPTTQRIWFWLTVAVMPAFCLGLGMFVWVRRRG